MGFHFGNVLVFGIIAVGFIFGGLLIGKLIRPDIPDPEKRTIYECGERPIGPAWFRFNPRFYLFALVFVVFDVEVAFMFPVVTVFKQWIAAGHGLVALLEIVAFVVILGAGLVYVWAEGDLAWVKKTLDDRGLPVAADVPGGARERREAA